MNKEHRTGLEIAVVGMAGRFPGAETTTELWENLLSGVESITRFTPSELLQAGVSQMLLDDPSYVPARGLLADIDCFDAALFGYSPREARLMDPQHRLFLESAWAALEDGATSPKGAGRSIGVFAAVGFDGYLFNLYSHRHEPGFFDSAETLLGNEKDHVATRVSYKLDLTGPSMTVQSACSSSLTAVHEACRSLLAGDCDGALAGGASVAVPQRSGYLWADGGALSRDGQTRAFDARASGFVPGSGVGVLYLKRLADAEEEGDPIRAVILGSAANNDGAKKIGYTAPSVERQAEAISAAYGFAEIDPAEVGYVEAHGTGTALGDPIEIEALTRAFRSSGSCLIGSVKTNIGHLDAAAGVAGLIKAILCVEHGEIPASLNYTEPNPRIAFEDTPFSVAATRQPWSGSRTAGVSALGLGGTNVHVVVTSYPQKKTIDDARCSVLAVSGATKEALTQNTERLCARASSKPLSDVAYTLQVGRRELPYRCAVATMDLEDGLNKLQERVGAKEQPPPSSGDRPVLFLFPGGGAQHAAMAHGLLAHEPHFRQSVEACCGAIDRGDELLKRLVDPPSDRSFSAPAIGLPALFVIEYALAQLWQHWGVTPKAMIGHSLGEYVAACLSGVLSLPDALALVALRGRLFETLAEGAMLSVNLSEAEIREWLAPELSLAAINGPTLCTVAGPVAQVNDLQDRLTAREIINRRIRIDVASHCAMVSPILPALADFLQTITLSPPGIPYASNLTGTWASEAVQQPSYWTEHLRQPVRFSEGLSTVLQSGEDPVLLEVGPSHSLSRLAMSHEGAHAIFASQPHATDETSDVEYLYQTLGQLWCAGIPVRWDAVNEGHPSQRLSLPTYAFAKTRYWVDHETNAVLPKSMFYVPVFTPAPSLPENLPADDALWLVFANDEPLVQVLIDRLRRTKRVATVRVGPSPRYDGRWELQLRSGEREDYQLLKKFLAAKGARQVRILHCWQLGAPEMAGVGRAVFALSSRAGYESLTYLAQVLIESQCEAAALSVLTSGAQDAGGDPLLPERATALGPCVVLPQEAPQVSCRLIDISRSALPLETLADRILTEPVEDSVDSVVAYRGRSRLVRRWHNLADDAPKSSFETGGHYLLVGGLGRLYGLHVGRHLAEHHRAHLYFVDPGEPAESLQQLEKLGGTVHHFRNATRALDAMPEVTGVLHFAATEEDPSVHCPIEDVGRTSTSFSTSIFGLYELAQLLEGRPYDRCLVFSSNVAVLGGPGTTAYCAANNFAGAFCSKMRADGHPWMSIHFDEWQEETDYRFGMPIRSGLEAMERALPLDAGQLVVSRADLSDRIALGVQAEEKATTPIEPAAIVAEEKPLGEIEEALIALWRELLGVEQVGREDNFFALGGHSLLAVHLRAKIKKRLNRNLPLEAIFRSGTIAGMATAITADTSTTYRALVEMRGTGSRPPFYCVHAASGSARVYQPLCDHLGEDQPFYAFEARGLDGRAPFPDMEEMVSTYLRELTAHQPEGPYFIGGWCAGGTVAYEMAQRLHRTGAEVFLALLDVSEPNEEVDVDDTRDLFSIARSQARSIGIDLPLRRSDLDGLSETDQETYVLDQYKLFRVMPMDTTVEEMRSHWQVFRQVLQIVRSYRFEPYGGRIALFLAEELDYRKLVDVDVVQDFRVNDEILEKFQDRADAWKRFSPHPQQVYWVPGYHSMMALEPQVEILAERISDWIAEPD